MQGLWRPWPWDEIKVEAELLERRPPPLQALDMKLFVSIAVLGAEAPHLCHAGPMAAMALGRSRS